MKETAEERAIFEQMLVTVFTGLGKPEPDKPTIRFYFESLKHYSIEDVRTGLTRHVRDPDQGQWVPKPADVIRNIEGNSQTQSEIAWSKVDTAVRSVGPYQSVCFDDYLIHQVIGDMGGWVALCNNSTEDFTSDRNQFMKGDYPFKHNEFIRRYRGYVNRPPLAAEVPGRLIGMAEVNNTSLELDMAPPAPVLIGNPQLAMQVLANGSAVQKKLVHRADELAPGALDKIMARLEKRQISKVEKK